jgi:hypothetical protein
VFPNVPTLKRKARLKAYKEFKEKDLGKPEAELKSFTKKTLLNLIPMNNL